MVSGYLFRPMNEEDAREIAAWRRFAPARFRLSVAAFNEHAGFRRVNAFTQSTNGGEHPFLLMTREA
jgi:hypothetical protein